ncbi:Phage integrase family protein [Pseudorhizobium banfieldiae]|uniref:Phage integrase family protein n=1 Tax=Pseudorhizobium banfieldiae TaxID=1125847 RepID=L0NDW9_9HYPH|nr:DUF6538 domain-containing protein [Pseudorhizobium banfieldiae]CAD6605804.1 integrase [arsenite-oxidising bacterium NT-25]CCF19074.1 Phage integrase family protein [Pseudorhizobium banfieldiae]
MGRHRKSKHDLDRYLLCVGGNYYYRRRVPTELADIDERGHTVKISLKTTDLARARTIRDLYEKADDDRWASMLCGEDQEAAKNRYLTAIKRAKAMGFSYQPSADLANAPLVALLERVEAILSPSTPKPVVEAVMGTVSAPAATVSDAFKVYEEEITPHQISGKSAGQRAKWLSVKKGSKDHFISVMGDMAMDEITRDDARRYYNHWLERIAPKEGRPTHTPDIGNRRLGDMRVLYREYYSHMKQEDRVNPFEGLRFKDKAKRRRKRHPFTTEWITDKILKPGALAGLNDEARAILLIMMNVGARPSEICNLTADRIQLQSNIPYIKIEPDDDPEDPREVKTETSIRVVPVTGIALEALRRFPKGFPRYRDKEGNFSAAINKYMVENHLRQSVKTTVYSFRHSFEDRMKNVKVDDEVRRILMGHAIDRPEYGEGGSLALKLEAMAAVALPCDPSIL